jgi:hypothetical protein
METLRNQHRAVIIGTFTIVAAWYYYFYYHYHASERPMFDLFAVLGLTLPGLAYLPVLFYEKIGWRIFNPRLDFDDQWAFIETQNALDGSGRNFVRAYDAWGYMRVDQGIDSIAVVEGQTFTEDDKLMSEWYSKTCDLDGNVGIVAALEHLPSPGTKGGNVKYGIEVFRVTRRAHTLFGKGRGKPTHMASIVYHCIEKESPAHQVEVKYVRLPRHLQGEPVSSKKIRQLLGTRS